MLLTSNSKKFIFDHQLYVFYEQFFEKLGNYTL